MFIPQHLHKPLQVLWWDSDEFMIIFLFLVGGLLFHWGFYLPMLIVPYLYGRFKKAYPRGFLKHLLYFGGFKEFKKYPIFFEKEFIE